MADQQAGSNQLTPEIALILAILFPGAGQFYNGQIGRGILIFFTAWLIVPWIWGMVDAFKGSKRINDGELTPARQGCLVAFLWYAGLFVIFIVIVVAVAILVPGLIPVPPA